MTERQDTAALLFTWLQRCAKEAAEERERERETERETRKLGRAERADHGVGVLRAGLCPRRIERYDESHDLLLPVVLCVSVCNFCVCSRPRVPFVYAWFWCASSLM